MSSDDSFMQIVRERLGKHDFLESGDPEKAGLFFNKWLVDGETFYVDMRKTPMRMYGYKDQGKGHRDTALAQDYVDNVLQDVKRDLVSIGCDLKQHGFDQLPEPKPKKENEKSGMEVKFRIKKEDLEKLAEITEGSVYFEGTVVTNDDGHHVIEGIKIKSIELRKRGQRTVDRDFF